MLKASRSFFGGNMHRELATTEVIAKRRRRVEYEPTTCDQLPSLLGVLALASELEIIYVN